MFIVFKKELVESGKLWFLLIVVVVVGYVIIDKVYEISKLVGILDFINLMVYDFYGSWDF